MMKEFYEDFTEDKDIEDISSGRFDFQDDDSDFVEREVELKNQKIEKPPHLPGVQPTVRFKNQTVQPAPQVQMPVYGQYSPAYYPPVQGVPVEQPVYPGYPPVYYPQPGQYVQPGQMVQPGQYVQYPGQPMPVYAQSVQPVQPVQPPVMYYAGVPAEEQKPTASAAAKNGADKLNPGTKVLYQSEDFERKDNVDTSVWEENNTFTVQPGITHEDVILEEEIVTIPVAKKKKPQVVIKRPPSSFTEDEMEIGTFELDAIALKHNSKANVLTHVADQKIPVTTDVNADEYERYFETQDNSQQQPAEKKKASSGETVRKVVLTVSIIAFIVAAAMLFNEYRLSKENDEVMQNVEEMIIDVSEPQEVTQKETTTKKANKKKPAKKETTTAAQTTVLTEQQQWDKIKSEYPSVVFPMNLQLKYAKLYAENQDFVGYLSADGVNLNLPIVQAEDDEEYLTKNFYGARTKYGCPFVTHVNNISPLDTNTVIFGHHMNNGTVFGTLDEYKSIEGFKKAPVITFNTLSDNYQWKIIAAFITNAYPEEDNGYVFKYYFTTLSTVERYASFLSEISQRSLYDTGVDVLPSDKILTLSTCSHEFNEARFVVVARQVRTGESPKVDVSRASVNENPRYPQAYYDKKKMTNPYADAYRWEVG